MRCFFRRARLASGQSPGEQNPKSGRTKKDKEAESGARSFCSGVELRDSGRDEPEGEQNTTAQINKTGINDDFGEQHKI